MIKANALHLYRGITVPRENAEEVKQNMSRNGIRGDEGKQWRFQTVDLKDRLEMLFNKPDLSTKDTRPLGGWFSTVCACGDKIGATHYATCHNRHRGADEVSFVITFWSPISDVYVDGRDFLYSCFQGWDSRTVNDLKMQNKWLVELFGKRVQKYFKKATLSKDQDYRIAMCDLACHDWGVVLDHAQNKVIIGGRYGTLFCSAFFVRTPIAPSQIIAVGSVESTYIRPQITLNKFFMADKN